MFVTLPHFIEFARSVSGIVSEHQFLQRNAKIVGNILEPVAYYSRFALFNASVCVARDVKPLGHLVLGYALGRSSPDDVFLYAAVVYIQKFFDLLQIYPDCDFALDNVWMSAGNNVLSKV